MKNNHEFKEGDLFTPSAYTEKYVITGFGDLSMVYGKSAHSEKFGKIIPFHLSEIIPWASRPKAEKGARLCPVGTEIQTLIFSKDVFTADQAKDWAWEHDFNAGIDEKENTYRMRQQHPNKFKDASFRTIDITNGIKAVIGCPVAKAGTGAAYWVAIKGPGAARGAKIDTSKLTKDILIEAANNDNFNEAVATVQKAIGQDDGGLAGDIFVGTDVEEKWPNTNATERMKILSDYAQQEQKHYDLWHTEPTAARGAKITGYDKVNWEAMRKEIKGKKAAIEAHELDAYDFMAHLSKKYIQKHDPKWAERTTDKEDPFADRMLKIFDEENVTINYSRGGRIKDRKYTSDQPHEKRYKLKRKSRVLRYKKS